MFITSSQYILTPRSSFFFPFSNTLHFFWDCTLFYSNVLLILFGVTFFFTFPFHMREFNSFCSVFTRFFFFFGVLHTTQKTALFFLFILASSSSFSPFFDFCTAFIMKIPVFSDSRHEFVSSTLFIFTFLYQKYTILYYCHRVKCKTKQRV